MPEIETSTFIARPLEEVFQFFSVASNLNLLTPPWLKFKILTPEPIIMAAGTLIDYSIVLKGIPMNWKTKITEWNQGESFVDEQLKGPYRTWIHTHTFEQAPGGTNMRDHVSYSLPLAPLSHVALPFVRNNVRQIFEYRNKVIREIFSKEPNLALA